VWVAGLTDGGFDGWLYSVYSLAEQNNL